MRLALLSPLAVAAALFACSTFSGSDDPPPPPPEDAGPDVVIDPGGCKPVVADPNAPAACGKDLKTDAENCGACGHRCVDTKCVDGKCEFEKLTDALSVFAIDGTMLYRLVGTNGLERADLSKRPLPLTFDSLIGNLSGQVQHVEVYNQVLYIGSTNDQTIFDIDASVPNKNAQYALLNAKVVSGHFLPGPTSYYLVDDPVTGQHLSRITGEGSVANKDANQFPPIARNGGDIYWTETLTNGANIFGPWDQAAPIVHVGTQVEALAGEGDTAFLAGGGYVSRTTRGGPVLNLAVESGTGVAFAISGRDLFYAVRRESAEIRHYVYRVDKCAGGVPVPLFDINVPITGMYLNEPTHVTVNTTSGLYRFRR